VNASRIPGQRAGLSRDRVLGAAREQIAEAGLEGLTMRALADRLGVTPNALYSHVESKTGLVDDLLDDVLAEVDEPALGGDPRAALHDLMSSTYDVLLAHPDLVPVYLARQGARGENAQRLGEIMLTQLERAGIGGPAAREAQRVLIVHTIGFAAFTSSAAGDPRVLAPNELRSNFEAGLHWLLAGIGVATQAGP